MDGLFIRKDKREVVYGIFHSFSESGRCCNKEKIVNVDVSVGVSE